ncbi:piggyBac transposable element-derived protein 3 [Nephila pilipes]|uniref:PiggyBac transposable element-derived protein 3 n=1 Tax=Nephila pilipes TaxID=299642 RepID=A0A8X6PTV1_NEPPI|nr:piggyBac transposable element-derived protein 3 [Nephila pilipes]
MSIAWIGYRHKMEAIGAHKKDILDYFSFRLNAASTLFYGLKQSRSRISSISSLDKSTENNEPPANSTLLPSYPLQIMCSNCERYENEQFSSSSFLKKSFLR